MGLAPDRIVAPVIWLVATFGLTVASFVTAEIVSEVQAHGIIAGASEISAVALPATESLANVRTELRHTSALTNEIARTPGADARVLELRKELRGAREIMDRSWREYLVLPISPVERELIGVAESNKVAMNASLDAALRMLRVGDREGALDEINMTARPANAATDEAVREAAALNRQKAMQAASRVVELRRTARTWGAALDLASVVFALAATYFLVRVGRRYWELVQSRTSELEHFTGRVAHDIRGPLSTVRFALDLASESHLTSTARAAVGRATRTLERISALVDGLLLYAMAGRQLPSESGANVTEILGGVVDDVRALAEEQQVSVECEPIDSSLVVACSPGVLVSMALNLVGNAIKYMGDSPQRRVALRARDMGRSVRVEVEDTGPGIPPEHQSTIFAPHVRGAEATVPGFGLGLATVQRLAQGHGGRVGLASKLGAGSLFWFELPKKGESERHGPSRQAGRSTLSPAAART